MLESEPNEPIPNLANQRILVPLVALAYLATPPPYMYPEHAALDEIINMIINRRANRVKQEDEHA